MLRIQLKPSPRLTALLLVAHAAGLAPLWLLDWSLALKLLAVAALALSGWWYVRRVALLRSRDAIVGLQVDSQGKWSFATPDGVWHAANLSPPAFVLPALSVLSLKPQGKRIVRHVVLLPDALSAEDFRALRVWLRWGKDSAR